MMLEAVKIWNEPNNKSHWDFEVDPEWKIFAEMAKLAADAIRTASSGVKIVLGGISPIDPDFIARMGRFGVLDRVDVVGVHGFPLDWNHWPLDEWPDRIDEIREVTDREVWVTEAGISSFGAEEVQQFGLERTAALLLGNVERCHWYSLWDLPKAWSATTRHREAEGSSYYRHFYMGLLREDGSPKLAAADFTRYAPEMGICQWFHFQDPRLEDAIRWLKRLGVKKLRTGLSWSDWYRQGALEWFDRQMCLLDDFDLTLTCCFTPEQHGIRPHYTSAPKDIGEFADFCAAMTRRYA